MVLIREEQKNVSGLGPIGIIREAFELFLSHFNFFVLVQIFPMLPLVIFAVAFETLMHQNLNIHFSDIVWAFNSYTSADVGIIAVFTVLMGFGALPLAFVYEAIISLSSSVILYAVGLHYTGHSVSFKGALHASYEVLWMRLTITNFFKDFQLYLIVSVGLIISCVGLLLQNQVMMVLMFGMSLVFLFAAIGYLDIIFFLAAGMAVLEKDFRSSVPWSRILSLLEGRAHVAVLFELLSWVPIIILSGFQLAFGIPYQITQKSLSPGNLTASILCIVIYMGLRSFLWQIKAVCCGVQYLSFKAYHEGIAVEPIPKQSLNGGFELVASENGVAEGESDDAKLGGQEADTSGSSTAAENMDEYMVSIYILVVVCLFAMLVSIQQWLRI